MAQPSNITAVELTLRCGHPYRGGVCRRAIGWVGRDDGGELAVEWLSRRVETSWEGVVTKARVRSWEDRPLVTRFTVLRRDLPEGVQADCDRHGACRFTVEALEDALQASTRDLTGV